MAQFIIIRMGIPFPTQAEAELINEISSKELDAVGCPIIPSSKITKISGMISIIGSDLSAKEIADRFQDISTYDDNDIDQDERECFPVLVFKLDDDHFSYNRDFSDNIPFGEMLNERFDIKPSHKNTTPSIKLGLDDILDIMSKKGGYDKLSKEEKKVLEKYND